MKEKILKWVIRLAEIGTVMWAVFGIMSEYRSNKFGCMVGCVEYHIVPVLAYFFSAILILYLIKNYKK